MKRVTLFLVATKHYWVPAEDICRSYYNNNETILLVIDP